MKIKLFIVIVLALVTLSACSEGASSNQKKEENNKIDSYVVNKEKEEEKEITKRKIKDAQDILQLSLDTAAKTDDNFQLLKTKITIDQTGRIITISSDVYALADKMNLNHNMALNAYAQGVNLETWGWIKERSYEMYGKEAGIKDKNEITIVFINSTDGKEVKRM